MQAYLRNRRFSIIAFSLSLHRYFVANPSKYSSASENLNVQSDASSSLSLTQEIIEGRNPLYKNYKLLVLQHTHLVIVKLNLNFLATNIHNSTRSINPLGYTRGIILNTYIELPVFQLILSLFIKPQEDFELQRKLEQLSLYDWTVEKVILKWSYCDRYLVRCLSNYILMCNWAEINLNFWQP